MHRECHAHRTTGTLARRYCGNTGRDGQKCPSYGGPPIASLLVVIALVSVVGTYAVADEEVAAKTASTTFRTTIAPFLKTHCIRCHGPKQQKAQRRFDGLNGEIGDDNALADYQDVLDQLNLSTMPPEEAKPQPTDDERRAVVEWLTTRIANYHATRKSAHGTVLRRLNAREYRKTIRDLLHVDTTMFDPTATFPRDQTTEHLDNVGETLVTSGFLLARYLEAADLVVEKAMTPLDRPEVHTWTFTDGFRQQPEIDQVHKHANKFEWMTLYDVVGADKPEGAYGPILAFKEGVPFDGVYEIRLRAEGVNREHPYDRGFVGTDPSEPLRLGIVPGDYTAGFLHHSQPVEPLLAEIELADEPEWYTVRVPLDAGYTPRFTFRNGLLDARNMWGKLVRKYPDQFPKRKRGGIVEDRRYAIEHGKLPQIRIHEIEIRGPLYDEWPTASHRAILGDDWERVRQTGELDEETARRHLRTFATRAFRRPVRDEELDRLLALSAARRKAGRTPVEAHGDALRAVLCSPHFLYMQPPDDESETAYGLATRLSYFLWSSMPDETLFDLAATGELANPVVLAEQVDRMLDDPRSEAFVEGFLGSWLALRDLGSMPPDRGRFGDFYQYDLDRAMRQETHLFTRHLLDENLDVRLFLDSNFTFVNRPLARHYGLEPPEGPGFSKVSLSNRRRGGLLGQASVLTVSANGIDTSPVVRGVWLLENVLGTPPSPPPPDVEPLDPDSRGAKSIRDQLEKHRSVATCNECHRRIDPIGFALENFDPIGGWRTSYPKNVPIDPSGELPNGGAFDDVVGFKTILLERREQFTRNLVEKLLAYGTGRHVTAADRPAVDRILSESKGRGDGFRELVKLVVASEPFRSP